MGALTRGDKIERQLQKRILTAYTEALKTSVEGIKDFLREIQRVEDGVKKPPSFYDTPEKIERWKAGFYRELVRRYRVQEIIMEEINRAGALAAGEIREAMADVYMDNLGEVQQLISAGADRAGVNVSFAAPTRRQVAAAITSEAGPFSKLAYKRLGQNVYVRQRLQSELAQACILGESQTKIIQRIRAVTGQSVRQARRVAQTERTRVQAQARSDAEDEAAEQGVRIVDEWRCRFVNSREEHMARDGVRVMHGDVFPGTAMHYPGDPAGPAHEVINCHCYIRPRVLLSTEALDKNGKIVKVEAM